MQLRSGGHKSISGLNRPQSLKRRRPNEQADSQKRQCIDSGTQTEPQIQLAPLTHANLRKHNRVNSLPMAPKRVQSIRSADPRYPQKILKNGIIRSRYNTRKPKDYDAIREELNRARASGSPDSIEHKKYCFNVDYAMNEHTLEATTFSRLRKHPEEDYGLPYVATFDQEWTEVGESSLTKGLTKPRPDYSESFAMDKYPEATTDQLSYSLQPSLHNFSMPRFAAKLKAPNGANARADAQAAYVGAVMTEALMKQDAYLDKSPAHNMTQALTVTAIGQNVSIQANHSVMIDGNIQYHNVALFDSNPYLSRHAYSETRRHVRNAQDWARNRSEQTLQQLQSHDREAALLPPTLFPTVEPVEEESTMTTTTEI